MPDTKTQDQTQTQDQTHEVVYVRAPNGKFAPGNRPPGTIRTTERAKDLHRLRKEKTQRLLREQIKDQTQDRTGRPAQSSAEAVAIAGGMLWEEVVLNPDAYPRDRLEAFLRLGERADILPGAGAGTQDQRPGPGDRSVLEELGEEAALAIVRAARARRQDQDQDQDQDQ